MRDAVAQNARIDRTEVFRVALRLRTAALERAQARRLEFLKHKCTVVVDGDVQVAHEPLHLAFRYRKAPHGCETLVQLNKLIC